MVDPRFPRSASKAALYVRLRPGTDIALMAGLINYILQNEPYPKEYVLNYTNAALVVRPEFSFQNGLCSGYDKTKNAYDPQSWDYETDEEGKLVTDPTLQHPRCVFQLMEQHSARHTPAMVSATTGVSRETFLKLAELYCANAYRWGP